MTRFPIMRIFPKTPPICQWLSDSQPSLTLPSELCGIIDVRRDGVDSAVAAIRDWLAFRPVCLPLAH